MTKYIFVALLLCLKLTGIVAQPTTQPTNTDIKLKNYTYQNESLENILTSLDEQTEYSFQYNPKDIVDHKMSLQFSNISFQDALSMIAQKSDLIIKIRNRDVILYKSNSTNSSDISEAEKNITISGYVYDSNNSESLIGATILDLDSGIGTSTNEYGFYSLSLQPGQRSLSISYLGYHEQLKEFNLESESKLIVRLESNANQIEEIVITSASSNSNYEKTQMSQHSIAIEQLDAIPVVLGEEDIMKSIQLLPGIKSGTEGTSGIYVRGGSQDQNLILLDGVPVYNPAHALGIFSVFNSDALKSVNVIKAGHPARFGGRLSSVIDVRMKEGNLQEWHGEGSVGLISSKATLSGPILKDRLSILVSARRTYADLLLTPLIRSESQEDINPALFFHDFNGKLQYRINDRHRIYLSGYLGRDRFGGTFSDSTSVQRSLFDWGNSISALRWNYQISPKLFANTTLTYSKYSITTANTQDNTSTNELRGTNYTSGIEDSGAKVDFDYVPNSTHYLRFGIGLTRHSYNPGITANIQRLDTVDKTTQRRIVGPQALDLSIYVEDEISLGKFHMNVGAHTAVFKVENSTYNSVQPRIGLRYMLGDNISAKASFNTMTQFINLVSSESLSLPSDIWIPSTDEILPQNSTQYAIGLGGKKGVIDWEVEAYYKDFENVLSFIEGTSLLNNDPEEWEDQIIQGKGEAYGMEMLLSKTEGKLTGWLGYTLSWSNRKFEGVNQGEKFPFRYDRRHDISLTGSYKINKNISFSANWIYNTGNAITIPEYQYLGLLPNTANPTTYQNATLKNTARMSPTHRLDWSVSFNKKKKRYERTWVIGAYNSYNNKNPFYLDTNQELIYNEQSGEAIGYVQTLEEKSLLPVLPTVSYNLKF